MKEVSINLFDDEGIYVVIAEGRMQGPIIMETEGEDSSRQAAEDRARSAQNWIVRHCICRLVPVEGNMLLPKDMERMQRK